MKFRQAEGKVEGEGGRRKGRRECGRGGEGRVGRGNGGRKKYVVISLVAYRSLTRISIKQKLVSYGWTLK